jgi:hypothetical protein
MSAPKFHWQVHICDRIIALWKAFRIRNQLTLHHPILVAPMLRGRDLFAQETEFRLNKYLTYNDSVAYNFQINMHFEIFRDKWKTLLLVITKSYYVFAFYNTSSHGGGR